ncbi:MAG: YeeE/YedE thiosulfate transporter family protein [Chitinophagales bacterium]
MIEWISQPWAWYVSGPMITLIMLLLLWLGGEFGVSSTMRTTCAMLGAGKKSDFFNFDWKSQMWNIAFAGGAIIGGFIAHTFLQSPEPIGISVNTIRDIEQLGIAFDGKLAPDALFSWEQFFTLRGMITVVLGGFLVGFGTRYAGGCTSGHAISGLSNLQLPSLIAVIGFFVGGLIMTHFLLPFIMGL